jgi:hypothetical protein
VVCTNGEQYRCQLGFFDNLNSAKKVANKILKKSPKSAMAFYKGWLSGRKKLYWFFHINNVSKDKCKLFGKSFSLETYSFKSVPSFQKRACYIPTDKCKTAINQADKIFKGKKWSQEKSTYCDNGKCVESKFIIVKNHHCSTEKICGHLGWNETLVKVYNAEKK